MKLFILVSLLNFLFSVSSLPVSNSHASSSKASSSSSGSSGASDFSGLGPSAFSSGSGMTPVLNTYYRSLMAEHVLEFGRILFLRFENKNEKMTWRAAVLLEVDMKSQQIIVLPFLPREEGSDLANNVVLAELYEELLKLPKSSRNLPYTHMHDMLVKFNFDEIKPVPVKVVGEGFVVPPRLKDEVLIPLLVHVMKQQFDVEDSHDGKIITDSVRMRLIDSFSAAYPNDPEIRKVAEEERKHERQWKKVKVGSVYFYDNANGDSLRPVVVLTTSSRYIVALPFFHSNEKLHKECGAEIKRRPRLSGLDTALAELTKESAEQGPYSYIGKALLRFNFDSVDGEKLVVDDERGELVTFTGDMLTRLFTHVLNMPVKANGKMTTDSVRMNVATLIAFKIQPKVY